MTRERVGWWIGVLVGVGVGSAVTVLGTEARGWMSEMERRLASLEEGSARPDGAVRAAAREVEAANTGALTTAVDVGQGCGASGTDASRFGARGASTAGVSAVDWLAAAEGGS